VTVETPEDTFPRLVPVTYWFRDSGERERFQAPRNQWSVCFPDGITWVVRARRNRNCTTIGTH
jgi:hypothetical protein